MEILSMQRRVALAPTLVFLLCSSLLLAAERPRAVKSLEKASGSFDRVVHFQRMMTLQQRLAGSMVSLADESAFEVRVSDSERQAVRSRDTRERKMRVGVVKDVAISMEFSRERIVPFRATRHDVFGAVQGDSDGGFVWTGVLRSPDASALRLHFENVDLGGGELYVFTREGMAFGPYTAKGPNGTGDFWTNTVSGAEIIIQLHAGAADAPRFNFAGVGHLTDEFALGRNLFARVEANAANTKPCSFNADCVVDAACGTEHSAVNTAKNAVAHMLFASGGWLYICSGGLVADSDTGTNIPYFITANHCISRESEASSLETFFFYAASSCQACPDPGAASTTGASLVSTNKSSDYTLMRLSQNAPTGAAFLGWSTVAIANTNGVALYRISHPQGAPQAYSTHVVDTSKVTCRSWPRGAWIYSRDTLGATEGGSSGSPVVNGAGELVGQLSGGCGYNVNDECDSAANATVDGAFAAYYNSVAGWLGSGDGGGGCTDADGDGWCATEGDCNDNNASIFPGANDTRGKPGRDGVDNDCDGVADR
jgi:lysyl endopeptidase